MRKGDRETMLVRGISEVKNILLEEEEEVRGWREEEGGQVRRERKRERR